MNPPPLPGPPPAASPAPATAAGVELAAGLSDATVRSVVAEVALETVSEYVTRFDPADAIAHVAVARPAECEAAVQCVPLAPSLLLAPDVAGHLHRTSAGDRTPVALEVVAALIASRVARDLLDVRLAQALHQVDNLRIAQESNRTIGVAIGVLMATRRCTATEAFDLLRVASQNQNRKLRDIAADVPYTGTILEDARAAS